MVGTELIFCIPVQCFECLPKLYLCFHLVIYLEKKLTWGEILNCSCLIIFKDFVPIKYHCDVLVPQKPKTAYHFIAAWSVVPYKTNTTLISRKWGI